MHDTCLIIIHDPGMRPIPGEPGTFGLADECSTTELTLLIYCYGQRVRYGSRVIIFDSMFGVSIRDPREVYMFTSET